MVQGVHSDVEWRAGILSDWYLKFLVFLECRVERSSDQIIKPVNLEALTKWVGHIPDDVVREMPDIAPMLSVLGYDPYANPPVYGAPDRLVSENTRRYVADESSIVQLPLLEIPRS